ncbi:peptidoglycan DD-metalloendopeptidase family protein [Flavobacterium franklandianum]|uniref:Peptidoglycan DD-metalloendopeptidase family protein n=1 Tax=Flavobacterium franklandianum TaxID=2594430 RepID=A0A553CTM2_9FLAO|nr:peptidoglycan DD-metalloendopeptidase family protein [Flavobacterium franklandianum]TRX23863.1 peptidoglycan DD-metalloendopeptidase family protein [Flavobacterium franklandianum]TRX27947.1 peptidoglycan DD-metalloendopeptidase family protein [Flavobacterium franklandianum]
MKKVFLFIIVLFSVFSCKKTEPESITPNQLPKQKNEQFGFNFNDFNVLHDTIKQGDTFGSIIENQNLGDKQIYDIIEKIKDSFDVRTIRIGKTYTFLRSKDRYKKLLYAIYQPDRASYYIIDLKDSVSVSKVTRPFRIKKRTIAGELNGSFSEELQRQKVDPALANKLIKVYAWSIDFFKLKKGDQFGVIFTERYIDDTIYDGVDRLSAAFFEYKGKMIYAFPFAQNEGSGKIDYYDENGKALKNFFLKSPLKYANITSRFSRNRFHPVQMIWKAHKGTDYAAPTGTPIMTTASGIVEQTGYTAGNGNFVKVKHDKTYSTQYLHMSRILVRRGQRVTQGSVIGRVGSTGLATGPHVCYRFWKNGVQVDALRLKLPNSQPMESKNLPRFKQQIEPLKWELDSVANL